MDRKDILIPKTHDPYEPLHTDRFMDFEDFLDFGDAEERWELVGGLPTVPKGNTIGAGRMSMNLLRLFYDRYERDDDAFDFWSHGALVRIDDFNALSPTALIEPKPPERREWLICDPVLVMEVSFGCERDREILHERRAMFLNPARRPAVQEYLAIIDSGPPEMHRDRRPLMNFVPFAGRMSTAASRARRVYRFRPGGQVDRFTGSDVVELESIGLSLPASTFFADED